LPEPTPRVPRRHARNPHHHPPESHPCGSQVLLKAQEDHAAQQRGHAQGARAASGGGPRRAEGAHSGQSGGNDEGTDAEGDDAEGDDAEGDDAEGGGGAAPDDIDEEGISWKRRSKLQAAQDDLCEFIQDPCLDKAQAPTNARKKAPNAWILFCNDERPKVKRERQVAAEAAAKAAKAAGRDAPKALPSRDEFAAVMSEVRTRWANASPEVKSLLKAKQAEIAAATAPVRTEKKETPRLKGHVGSVARAAANASLRAGGAITKVKNLVKASANTVMRKAGAVKHYFIARREVWLRLELLFGMLTRICRSAENRTRMLLEVMRRSVRPRKGEPLLRRLFPRDWIKRMFECDELRPELMAESDTWKTTDVTMFNLVRCNCRATMKVINGLRVFANRCFPGTTVMQSAHNEVRDDMRTVFVRVGSKPAEPELLTRPEHAAAFLAGQEAAKAAREEEIKEAAKAADRELRRKQLSDAAKARWRA
jgi:hypothetical protein